MDALLFFFRDVINELDDLADGMDSVEDDLLEAAIYCVVTNGKTKVTDLAMAIMSFREDFEKARDEESCLAFAD